jgi:hypothetical protein
MKNKSNTFYVQSDFANALYNVDTMTKRILYYL